MSTFEKSLAALGPEPSAEMAAQTLRERVGQENVTQSSVLASRRLDDAMLRREPTSDRNRASHSHPAVAPETPPRLGHATATSAPEKRSTQDQHEAVRTQARPETGDLSPDAIEALFGHPIDVMVVSAKAKISDDRVLQREVIAETPSQKIFQQAGSTTAPATTPAESQREFVSAWQVDEFLVPKPIDQLFLTDSRAEHLAEKLAQGRADGLQTIAVTSVSAGEGRSTVAMGVALSIAFSGLRVALVDADRSGVRIASELQLDLDLSWPEAIRDSVPLEEVSVGSQADALTLVPLLDRDGGAEFEAPELNRLLNRLRQSFDMIVVDCGSSAIEDIMQCGTALIVRDSRQTSLDEVESLFHALRRSGVHGIGVIENFCD